MSVKQESVLDHGPTLDMVAKKLPGDTLREWVKVRAVSTAADKTDLQAMQSFMSDEREKQRTLGFLMDGESTTDNVKPDVSQVICRKCQKTGNYARDFAAPWIGGGGGGGALEMFPCCSGQHKFKNVVPPQHQ